MSPNKKTTEINVGDIRGVREALAILKEIEPELRKRLRKDLRKVAGRIAGDVGGAFPGAVRTYDPTRRKMIAYKIEPVVDIDSSDKPTQSAGPPRDQIALFRIVVSGLNAVFADLGRAHVQDNDDRVLAVEALERSYGDISRFAWPTLHAASGDVEDAIVGVLDDLAETLSARLERED